MLCLQFKKFNETHTLVASNLWYSNYFLRPFILRIKFRYFEHLQLSRNYNTSEVYIRIKQCICLVPDYYRDNKRTTSSSNEV